MELGFTLVEVLIVVLILIVLVAIAVPNYLTVQKSLRIAGDCRSIAGLIAEDKLRAAADYTHARVYANLNANTYHLEIWNKTGGSGGAGCWQTVGDSANSCTVAATSPVHNLSNGVTFGFGNIGAPPANTQPAIAQAPLCYTGAAGQAGNTVTIANTACIEFNSRGVPADPSASGKPDATGALYLTDGTSVYGVTVLASGGSQSWYAPNTQTATWRQL